MRIILLYIIYNKMTKTKDRPPRVYYDKKKKLYYFKDGKKKVYIKDMKKPTKDNIKVVNTIINNVVSLKRRQKRQSNLVKKGSTPNETKSIFRPPTDPVSLYLPYFNSLKYSNLNKLDEFVKKINTPA